MRDAIRSKLTWLGEIACAKRIRIWHATQVQSIYV